MPSSFWFCSGEIPRCGTADIAFDWTVIVFLRTGRNNFQNFGYFDDKYALLLFSHASLDGTYYENTGVHIYCLGVI